jgi:organic radical activating enzyme
MSQKLPVMERFYTIQGEGVHSGCPAYFIRLAGCDVGCVWCDVKESWNAEEHPLLTVEELIADVISAGANRVIVTGGEPLMHDLTALTSGLRARAIAVHLETSGVHPLSGEWNWITFSPKKFKRPTEEIFQKAHEMKVIVFHPSDIAWAEELSQKLNSDCSLLLQPEWERSEEVLPLILNHITTFPKWRLSLQTHKYIGVQ